MVSEIVGLAMQLEMISLYECTSRRITPNVGKAFQGRPTLFGGSLGALGSISFPWMATLSQRMVRSWDMLVKLNVVCLKVECKGEQWCKQ
jgi:hypothetical protein